MKIALDAMGSDNAPAVELEGMQLALEENQNLEIVLVGRDELLPKNFEKFQDRVEIFACPDVVTMHESPSDALRNKRNSSIAKGIELLKDNQVSGFVSAGNTGAVMAFALSILQSIPGVHRPTLATFFPTLRGTALVLDVGANVDAKPNNLLQFAVMGSIVASHILKKANPTVGLLNIGKEPQKGNELTQATFKLLANSGLNFMGNLEANDVFKGSADVIVCDGFVGNVMLKFGEGMVEIISETLKEYLASETKYRMRRWLSKPVLNEFISRMDYEEQGGAMLLGVMGTVVCAHGRSRPKAIKNAINTAIFYSQEGIVSHILEKFSGYNKNNVA
uniref:Phosphate acyltransferase n=1 Tax=candidate division WOR-3 bacterium TaxID=2052148 RepID=A0A7C6A9N1_UNCW3